MPVILRAGETKAVTVADCRPSYGVLQIIENASHCHGSCGGVRREMKTKRRMSEVAPSELKKAVESQHGCTATFVQFVPVKEMYGPEVVWVGAVAVFDIAGHPAATRAYAWSAPVEGSDDRRFHAMLHRDAITGPTEAVRAAIVADSRDAQT
jgi:hypothetical protein